MKRTVFVVEYCKAGSCPDEVRPLILFDHSILRVALVETVERSQQPRQKRPLFHRFLDEVIATLSFLPTAVPFLNLSAESAKRSRLNEEWRRQEEEDMSPPALLKWLDRQDADRIVLVANKWNLAWMFDQAIPGPPALHLPGDDNSVGTLMFIEAYCKECERAYPPDSLAMRHWGYDHGILAAGGGRRLVCPEKHVVLEVLDWQS
jgi:hypothetical protein